MWLAAHTKRIRERDIETEKRGGGIFKKLKGEEQKGEMRGFSIEKKRMALLGPSGHFIG